MKIDTPVCRYYTSYTGVQLPLKLVNELGNADLDRRITYFKGHYDQHQRLTMIEKMVYGEVEFTHRYEYSDDNTLRKAVVVEFDEEPRALVFDEAGNATEDKL